MNQVALMNVARLRRDIEIVETGVIDGVRVRHGDREIRVRSLIDRVLLLMLLPPQVYLAILHAPNAPSLTFYVFLRLF